MSKVVSRTECPSCAAQGNDLSGDNLIEFEDGSKHCYACGYHDGSGSAPTPQAYKLPPHTYMPDSGIVSKGITKKTLDKFGVVWRAEMREDGTPETEDDGDFFSFVGSREGIVVFPYYDWDGRLVGSKQRNFAQEKKTGKKSMWYEGDSSKVTWFGLNTLNEKSLKLILTEGETDTMTFAQVMPAGYSVLGLSGASSVEKAIKASYKKLQKFEAFYLAFDNDDAGNVARDKALELLPSGSCYVVNLPAGYKDVNEMLLDDKREDIVRILKEASHSTPEWIMGDEELEERTLDYLFNKTSTTGYSSGLKSFDESTGGLIPGKLITITGMPGCGKSTLVENILRHAALVENRKCFVMSFEMPPEEVNSRLIQQHIEKPIYSNPNYPKSDEIIEQVVKTHRVLKQNIKFYRHVGSSSDNDIIAAMQAAIKCFGVDLIIFDNYTSASDSQDWKDLDRLTNRIKTKVALGEKPVCILAVSHTTKEVSSSPQQLPTLGQLRAAGGVGIQSDTVIAIARESDDSPFLKCKTVKNDRRVGKMKEFRLEMRNYKLRDATPDINTQTKHTNEHEKTKQVRSDSREWVPVETGREDTPELPADGVRTDEDTLLHVPLLPTRLHTEQWDSSRDKGEADTGGCPETEGGQETLERPRPQSFGRNSIRGRLYLNGFRFVDKGWYPRADRDNSLSPSELVYSNAERSQLGGVEAVQEENHN